MDSVVIWILTVAGIPALLVLVLSALATLRDEFVSQGWVKADGRLGRQTSRSAAAKIAPTLDSIGLTDDVRRRVARAAFPALARQNTEDALPDLDNALLTWLKPWVRDLGAGTFRGLSWYIDTMGAVHQPTRHAPSLADIQAAWISYLALHQFVDGVELILVPKDGNPILGSEVIGRLPYSKLVVVKGERDTSRVLQTGSPVHSTDFEGLRSFLETRGEDPAVPTLAIAADDSVTTGRSMMSGITRFNEFVRSTGAGVEPIEQAVTLFRIVAPDSNAGVGDPFVSGQYRVKLHSLLAFTNEDLAFLASAPLADVIAAKARFKKDPSCDISASLR